MKTTVYYLCGRPHVTGRMATCSGGNYINFINPSKNFKK